MSQPRYSITPGDFVDDKRARLILFKVMHLLGRHSNRHGWCRLSQIKMARRFEVVRQTVNAAIADLVAWGYVEKRGQAETHRSICFYRVLMDRGEPGDDGGKGGVSAQDDTGVSASDDTGVSDAGDTACQPRTTQVSPPEMAPPVASRDDTITIKNNDPPKYNDHSPYPSRGRERGRSIDQLQKQLEADGASQHVIDQFIAPMLGTMTLKREHRQLTFLTQLAEDLAGFDASVLDEAVRRIRAERSVFPSIKQAAQSCAKAFDDRNPIRPILPGTRSW